MPEIKQIHSSQTNALIITKTMYALTCRCTLQMQQWKVHSVAPDMMLHYVISKVHHPIYHASASCMYSTFTGCTTSVDVYEYVLICVLNVQCY